MNTDDGKKGSKKKKSPDKSPRSLSTDEEEMSSKVEEKLKSELTHAEISEEIEEEGSEEEDKDRTLYAYCSRCEENIFIHYKESFVKNAKSYPIYLVWVHGKPFHGLLVRIDKNFVSRGERLVHLEFDPDLSNHYS